VEPDLLLQAIVSGALIGGLYALMSLGLSLSWGALGSINLVHFMFILIGAYLTYQLTVSAGVNPLLTAIVVVPLAFLAGAVLQVFFELARVDEFKSLIVSFGLLIIIQSLARTVWSADFRTLDQSVNPYVSASASVGGIAFQVPLMIAFAAAALIACGTRAMMARTFFGKAVRAVVHDADIARSFGVDPRRVRVLLAGMASAYSGLAGVLVATFQSLSPTMAVGWFGIVFPVVILGGLGNALGNLLAGIIIGVAAGVATVVWGPLSATLVTFSIMVIALLFRPQGLFTRTVAA
jgi:branched-chain amino acid transport system permease protein